MTSAQIAARDVGTNSAVIVRGGADGAQLATVDRAAPSVIVINYEQSGALNAAEAAVAAQRGFLAKTCGGQIIHPRNIPQVTLMDMTNPQAQQWRAGMIGAETSSGYDQTYLDTVGSYFRDEHYTGHPCHNGVPVSDAQWRDASIAVVSAVRAATGKPVIVNGAGLGSGGGYLRHKADSDMLIAAADGVQIEHFARSDAPKDSQFLTLIQARGKSAFAKCDSAAETCRAAFSQVAGTGSYLALP